MPPGLTVTTLRAAWVSPTLDDAGCTRPSCWTPARRRLVVGLVAMPLPRRCQRDRRTQSVRGGDRRRARSARSTASRQPWYVPGWLASMAAWIDERLADAGLRRTRRHPADPVLGPQRPAAGRDRSRSGLGQGSPDIVRPRDRRHRTARRSRPGPGPSADRGRPASGRLLMVHVEGPLLADVADPAAWMATLARLGETQRVLAAERDRLPVAGVASAPLAALADDDPRAAGGPRPAPRGPRRRGGPSRLGRA